MNIKKTAAAIAMTATMLATSGCLTAEFWNCCLFGENPTAKALDAKGPQDLPLPRLTRQVAAPTMSY
ncbi:MAG: hypothetical protein Q8O67_03280 [Deltaproteobacteria bacterium]|nr:hypothetical protein [Deltaproteobacteria bacterium]